MIYPCKFYQAKVDDHIFWAAESLYLKGCVGQGDTFDEAVKSIEENEKEWLDSAKKYAFDVPEIPIENLGNVKPPITNREWLNNMTDEEFVDFLLSEDFSRLKMSWTSTFIGLREWLKKEHSERWIIE